MAAVLGLGVADGALNPSSAGISCTIAATNIAFGNVDSGSSSNVDSTLTLTVTCDSAKTDRPNRMCVDISGGTDFDTTSRKLASGTNRLRYQLYSDTARTTAWGSWSAGIFGGGVTWDVNCAIKDGCTASHTVYGRVPGGQGSVPTGSYSSSLSVYFTYRDNNDKTCPDPQNGNGSASFSATATVVPTCQVSAANLNFGSVGLLTAAVDGTNSLSVTCTSGTAYQVGLSAGNGSGATVAARKMTKASTSSTTTYSLYRDVSRSQVWGTTIGTDTQSGTGNGSAQSLTVYGRVPSQTTPPPGVYTDTIVVTVTY